MDLRDDDNEEEEEEEEGKDTGRQVAASRESFRVKKKVHNIIKNWIFALPNLDHTSRGYNVTPKVVKLVQVIKTFEPQGESFRGIIFGNLNMSDHVTLS